MKEAAPSDKLDRYPIHPAALLFPPYTEEELQELAADIKKTGYLIHPIMLCNGSILDGVHRYKACKIAGIAPKWEEYPGNDPYAYAISANIQRRHLNLTTEQKRELIAKLLKAQPEKSNNAIAKDLKVASDKTIAAVREELEATSEIPKLEKRVGADGKARKKPAKQRKVGVTYLLEDEHGTPRRVSKEAFEEGAASERRTNALLIIDLLLHPEMRTLVIKAVVEGERHHRFGDFSEAVAALYAELAKAGR